MVKDNNSISSIVSLIRKLEQRAFLTIHCGVKHYKKIYENAEKSLIMKGCRLYLSFYSMVFYFIHERQALLSQFVSIAMRYSVVNDAIAALNLFEQFVIHCVFLFASSYDSTISFVIPLTNIH